MKEIDKVNLFIQFLIVTSKFENQEEIGKFVGYPNKSSFSQMLKKDMTSVFKEKFYNAFPEFDKFIIGFANTSEKICAENVKDENYEEPTAMEDLVQEVRAMRLVNRTYLRSIITHLDIGESEIEIAKTIEEKLEK